MTASMSPQADDNCYMSEARHPGHLLLSVDLFPFATPTAAGLSYLEGVSLISFSPLVHGPLD